MFKIGRCIKLTLFGAIIGSIGAVTALQLQGFDTERSVTFKPGRSITILDTRESTKPARYTIVSKRYARNFLPEGQSQNLNREDFMFVARKETTDGTIKLVIFYGSDYVQFLDTKKKGWRIINDKLSN